MKINIGSYKSHAEAFSEPILTSKMVIFVKKTSSFQPLTNWRLFLLYSLKSLMTCRVKLAGKGKTSLLIDALPS